MTTYSFSCSDFPGMEGCPGHFVAESREEVRKLAELHAAIAHGEDPAQWSDEDKAMVAELIRQG